MSDRVKLLIYTITDGVDTEEQYFVVPESMTIGDHAETGQAICECFSRETAEFIVALWNSKATPH